MSNAFEKRYAVSGGTSSGADGSGSTGSDLDSSPIEQQFRPSRRGIKGFYYNPVVQVWLLGFVCFMCPGLFNALNGLGGGGQLDSMTSANANSALYSAFAFFAFFAGYVQFLLHSFLSMHSPGAVVFLTSRVNGFLSTAQHLWSARSLKQRFSGASRILRRLGHVAQDRRFCY